MKRILFQPLLKSLLLFITASLLLTSCKSGKTVTHASSNNKSGFEAFDFEALSIRAKLRFDNAGEETKATAHIRIRKDSAIWVSVSKTTVEGARIIVTPDTIMMIDRINKLYYTFNYAELQKKFNFAFDYKMLESALTGEPYLPSGMMGTPEKKRKYYILEETISNLRITQFIERSKHKLSKVEAIDAKKNELGIEYDAFEMVEGQLFPHHNIATIRYNNNGLINTTTIDLEYNKVSKEDASLKLLFKINSKYQEGE